MASRQGGSRFRSTATVVVIVVGLGVTAALAFGARSVHDNNEDRLLRQRTRETADVLGATIQSLQTPLASAAEAPEATDADPQRVGRLLAPIAGENRIFASAAVWSSDPTKQEKPTLVYGEQPTLAKRTPEQIRARLARALKSPTLTVIPARGDSGPRLQYT